MNRSDTDTESRPEMKRAGNSGYCKLVISQCVSHFIILPHTLSLGHTFFEGF